MKALIEWIKQLIVILSDMSGEKPKEEGEPKWLTIARGELGQKEIPGSKDNPRILEYHQATDLKATDDETPYCSSFVNWCMMQAGVPRTKSALARSWLKWGVALKKPKVGAVTILWRGSPTASTGHVGLWLGEDDEYVTLLGANQSDMVKISKYEKSKVLGYRWPA